MDKHRSGYVQWKKEKCSHTRSYDIFDKFGVENCVIYLIENYPCETVDQLRTREGHFIKTLKCVNKKVAGRSKKEYKQVYYAENKSKINETNKEYYNNNLEKSKANIKKYADANKVKIDEYQKQYQIENLEKLKEYRRQYFQRKQAEKKAKKLQDAKLDLEVPIDI